MKKLLLTLLSFFFLSSTSYADDISKAVRGPTNWQADTRIVYSRKDNKGLTETLNSNFILKYWDGDAIGKWGFADVPYNYTVQSPEKINNGIGNITIGAGPRAAFGSLHFLAYGALTIPSGETGTKRYDTTLGLFTTFQTLENILEIDGVITYKFTGKEIKENMEYDTTTGKEIKLSKEQNPKNEIYAGIIAGVKLIDTMIIGTGVTSLIKVGSESAGNSDYLVNLRGVIRIIISKYHHIEIVGDKSIKEKNIPTIESIGIYYRNNF